MGQTIHDSFVVVLDCYEHGESDKIVTFFCKDIGLLRGIAKGANRSRKRFVNKLELFSHLRLYYQQNNRNSLAFVTEAELINSYLNLRKNSQLYTSAEVIREFILMTSRELSGDEGLFDLITWCFGSLDQKSDHWPVLSLFLIRLMDIIGYRPDLSICYRCQQPLSTKREYLFHRISGTLICDGCINEQLSRNFQPLSHGTIKFLESALELPLERLHRLRPSKVNVKESIHILRPYLRHLFQRDIQAWKVLVDMEK